MQCIPEIYRHRQFTSNVLKYEINTILSTVSLQRGNFKILYELSREYRNRFSGAVGLGAYSSHLPALDALEKCERYYIVAAARFEV